VFYQRVKVGVGADGASADWEGFTYVKFVTAKTTVTRPADTNAYAAGDCWSDSTTAPTAGGFTLTSAGRASGGSGVLTDMVISTTAASSTLQGKIVIFDTSVTAVNDNSALAITDAEARTIVGIVYFDMASGCSLTNNTTVHLQNLNIGYTCSGSANLRFLIRVGNAYTPANAEVLAVEAKFVQID
jgi:hypothetical protein